MDGSAQLSSALTFAVNPDGDREKLDVTLHLNVVRKTQLIQTLYLM